MSVFKDNPEWADNWALDWLRENTELTNDELEMVDEPWDEISNYVSSSDDLQDIMSECEQDSYNGRFMGIE